MFASFSILLLGVHLYLSGLEGIKAVERCMASVEEELKGLREAKEELSVLSGLDFEL